MFGQAELVQECLAREIEHGESGLCRHHPRLGAGESRRIERREPIPRCGDPRPEARGVQGPPQLRDPLAGERVGDAQGELHRRRDLPSGGQHADGRPPLERGVEPVAERRLRPREGRVDPLEHGAEHRHRRPIERRRGLRGHVRLLHRPLPGAPSLATTAGRRNAGIVRHRRCHRREFLQCSDCRTPRIARC